MGDSKKISLSDDMQLFLVSTVFGYDMTEEDSGRRKIREACIGRAYLDLARVIPYKFSSNYIEKYKANDEVIAFVNKKNEFKKTVRKILIGVKETDKASKIIADVHKSAQEFEEAIFKVDESIFTYGMAQKWVNMFKKYMWLFGEFKCDNENTDMPIDSYIIDALYHEKILTEDIASDLFKGKVGKNRASDYIKKWSHLNEDEYNIVQALIKANIPKDKTILSWENELWMNQAKKLRENGY
ncbi:MAG: hypothetical protein K6E46_02365 [Lachnospiraceae bacterium]|nr:hypothetical protein [Lachnospiraceae bacterium]